MLAVSGHWIIALWTNNAVDSNITLLYLMLGVVVADALWQTSRIVLVSANRHTRIAAVYLGAAGAAVLLSYILMPKIGVEGAALGLLVANIAIIPHATKGALALLQDKLLPYLTALALPPIVSRGLKR
jgi:O-antigen/teichoic acid export membrane protein